MANKVSLLSADKRRKNRLNFFYDLKEEMKKVSWTSKSELIHCTKIVIGTTFFFGIAIYLVDLLLKGSLDGLNMLVKWIVQ